MAGDSFGRLFTVTSFGESHGPALGCVVDGCPPGLALAQLSVTSGLLARAEPWWIAAAASSLPVPVSPLISTERSERATLSSSW
jgi:hypothetical protein